MQTLESLLKKGTTILKDNGLEEAGLDAWLLLEFKTGKNRAYYFAHGDEPVSDDRQAGRTYSCTAADSSGFFYGL